MLRKSVVILTMLLCSMATQVFALGLGTVTVESALNQPLRVRIEILQLGDTRLQDVTVQMASVAEFERFNIDRIGFLSNIRFSIAATPQGNFVTLTSSQIVREPYLSFILDTRWPSGRLLSEHTILLDLPVFNDQQPQSTVRQPISPTLQPPRQTTAPRAPAQAAPEPAPTPAVTVPQTPPAVSDEPAISQQQAAPSTQPETVTEPTDAPTPAAQPAPTPEPQPVPEPQPEPEPQPAPVLEEPAAITANTVPDAADAEPETVTAGTDETLSDIALRVRPNNSVSIQQTMLALQRLNPEAFSDANINRLRSGQVLRVPDLAEIQSLNAQEAVSEVNRQNQEFAQVDVQPLAAPTPSQDQPPAPQGQLSVVTSDDDVIDATAGTGQLNQAENAVLDQRIAELENQLAQQQEEADRARIAREEFESRLQELDEQIAAATEIIRLQDLQLAQLQQSLAQAAADQAAQAALIAESEAQTAEMMSNSGGFVSDMLRIITGNLLFIGFGLALVVLLVVVLLKRRQSWSEDDDEYEEIDEDDFVGIADDEDDDEQTTQEFQDYDNTELDEELDQIIGMGEGGDAVKQAAALLRKGQTARAVSLLQAAVNQEPDDQQLRLKLLEAIAEKGDLAAFEEQAEFFGDDPKIATKINELRNNIDLTAAQKSAPTTAKKSTAPAASKKITTDEEDRLGAASFLDDLGIDLDAFDDDDEEPSVTNRSAQLPSAPAPAAVPKSPDAEKPVVEAEPSLDDDSFHPDDMDLTFDLIDDDNDAASTESKAEEPDLEELDSEGEQKQKDSELVEDEVTGAADIEFSSGEITTENTLEFDVEDSADATPVAATADTEELDIESLEFETGNVDSAPVESSKEPEIEVETFAFDTEGLEQPLADSPAEAEKEVEIDAEHAVEFKFDKSEIKPEDTAAKTTEKPEDLETFSFDLDAESEATVVEKPAQETGLDIDIDDFDLEEETGSGDEKNEAATATAAADDGLDLDLDIDEDFLNLEVEGEAVIDSGEDLADSEQAVAPEQDSGDADGEVVDDEDDDFLDLDVLAAEESTEAATQSPAKLESSDDIEFDLDDDELEVASATENEVGEGETDTDTETALNDDDLDFLSEGDDVEIESIDDVEEVALLSSDDEVATKLELAYAYRKMGDLEGAREILREVISEGSDAQVKEADKLMTSLDKADA